MYGFEFIDQSLGQAQKCGRVKLVNMISKYFIFQSVNVLILLEWLV